MRPRRPHFTLHELNLIMRMAAIANAAPWGRDDYADWTEPDLRHFDSMWAKVAALIEWEGAK